MMPISVEDQEDIRAILMAYYGPDISGSLDTPTARTLQLTEELLLKEYKCNRQIENILHEIPSGIVGRGFLKNNLKRISKVFLREANGFRGCKDFVGLSMRTQIIESTW